MHIDDVRIDPRHVFIGEAQPRHGVGAHVVDEDLRLGHQRAQFGAAFVGLQVQRDAALVAVERHEGGAHVRVLGVLGAVALAVAAGVLHLDHVGAQIAQDLGGIGPEDEFCQVQNGDAVKRAVFGGHGRTPRDC